MNFQIVSVQGKVQCLEIIWAFRREKAAAWLYMLFRSLVPLCCVTQWTILTAQFFLNVNFTEEWSNRDRRQCVYPVRCLCSNKWGSHRALRIADYKGWNKTHLHATLREGFSLVRFTLFVLYQSLPLKQPCWADGKQFRWAQTWFSKMKIFSG